MIVTGEALRRQQPGELDGASLVQMVAVVEVAVQESGIRRVVQIPDPGLVLDVLDDGSGFAPVVRRKIVPAMVP